MPLMMKFPSKGASWALDLHSSMKFCENSENVFPGLWILLNLNTMH